jgi:hypothetical protein
MRKRVVAPAFGAAFLFLAVSAATAQEATGEVISALRDRAVVLDIVARVVEREENEVWNAASSRVTIPGRPVSIKLVGTNVVVLVQFTPYKRDDGRQVLVAQGQVWVNTKDAGMRYQTTMETIPVDFGERVYYFPLGSHKGNNDARIEIQIELKPYQGETPANDAAPADAKAPGDVKTPGDAKAAADPKASTGAKVPPDVKAPLKETAPSKETATPKETAAPKETATPKETAAPKETAPKSAAAPVVESTANPKITTPKNGNTTESLKQAVPQSDEARPIE